MLGTARDEAAPLLGRLEERDLLTSLLDDVTTRGQALVLPRRRSLAIRVRDAHAVLEENNAASEAALAQQL
jgi:hypothetical protein